MTGTAVTNYDAAWAEQAQKYADQEQLTGGTFLSTRGGTLSFGEETMPGNQACVIVLDVVKENTYYPAKFDPDSAAAPICYAFGREADEMAPHPSMQIDPNYFQPQAPECQGCKWNEWGSADQGRGKACQNRRRLALIPAGYYQGRRGSRDFDLELFTDPKHFQTADMAFIKLPVTSTGNWAKYVNQLSASVHRPPHGVISRLYLEPHTKFQYTVNWEMVDTIPDSLFQTIMARHEEAIKGVIQGYKVPEERAPAPQGSLRGLRRTR
jgi:hypothetical protein